MARLPGTPSCLPARRAREPSCPPGRQEALPRLMADAGAAAGVRGKQAEEGCGGVEGTARGKPPAPAVIATPDALL